VIAFLVAGTASGVGKTTTALMLMAAFRERGCIVQPFKCGPDFLDSGHHAALCERPSHNLDTWMLSAESNRKLFEKSCRGADVAIVEGMMGLYDGAAGGSEEGSSAEIAKLLQLPVVLVFDASKSARSIAAVVKGFESFDPTLRFAGIVLNGVSSDAHYRILQTAIESVTTTPLLGRIPSEPDLAIPERHLGLQTAEESATTLNRHARLAQLACTYLDLSPLLAFTCAQKNAADCCVASEPCQRLRMGVARDKAFFFYYEDNLDLLRMHGVQIVPFSPLYDETLPPDLDGLYLGGGYPELHAETLSANRAMRSAISAFAASDKPVYAECGGMMYLGESLATFEGETFPMAAVLPLAFEMTPKLVRFGYTEVELTEDCLLGKKGLTLRGHSFHHSQLLSQSTIPTVYRVHYSLSGQSENEGFCRQNVLASYIHLHFRSNPDIVPNLVQALHCGRSLQVTA